VIARLAMKLGIAGLLLGSTMVVAAPAPTVRAEPAGDDTVIAFLARGVGNGHGRGASQWGMNGRAKAGQGWQQILDTYYGGTSLGDNPGAGDIRVRLTGWDGDATFGVISTTSAARWAGTSNSSGVNYSSLYAVETSGNTFDIYGVTSGRACPGQGTVVVPKVVLQQGSSGPDVSNLQTLLYRLGYDPKGVDGQFGSLTRAAVVQFQNAEALPADGIWNADDWMRAESRLASAGSVDFGPPIATGVTGPITFSTTVSPTTVDAGAVLGACDGDGTITHYRGELELHSTGDGNRVVNELPVDLYLRGVVPKEISASWPADALRAQSVAARSFALSQNRYSYARTCDTTSCQVYAGAATRSGAASSAISTVEHPLSNAAIDATAGKVRLWPNGAVVSTEFSASNGPRTAGGAFPPVDDPFDDQPGNPLHTWTRLIDADSVISRYGLSSADAVHTANDPNANFDGIWDNRVVLGNGSTVSAWDFRNAYGLPSPGFELIPIRRTMTNAASFAFIGDSVGTGMAIGSSSELQVLTDGVLSAGMWSAVSGRTTAGGVQVAQTVPVGTDIVLVELGYNDDPSAMAGRIDAMMTALRDRQVGLVMWANVSTRSNLRDYDATNAALAAARSRWSELMVLDWNGRSSGAAANRWFSDGIHLTATGDVEFALYLRDQIVDVLLGGYTPPRTLLPNTQLRVPVLGVGGVPGSGVSGVALNVTSVLPVADGHMAVWPCGLAKPGTSAVNYRAGGVSPNAVVVPVDATGEVCVESLVETDVLVDVSAWFGAGAAMGTASSRLVDTRDGTGPQPPR
jgi:peptidoglycan hydrolase-like protein with peptidoglycan-binding domain